MTTAIEPGTYTGTCTQEFHDRRKGWSAYTPGELDHEGLHVLRTLITLYEEYGRIEYDERDYVENWATYWGEANITCSYLYYREGDYRLSIMVDEGDDNPDWPYPDVQVNFDKMLPEPDAWGEEWLEIDMFHGDLSLFDERST